MASTLRLFTRGGREETFSTTLVEDGYSRALRELVAAGFLTMDYTGTRRVYSLTALGRHYLEGKRMGKKKQANEEKNGVEPASPVQEPVERTAQEVDKARARRKKPVSEVREEPKAAPIVLTPGMGASPLEVIRLMREVRDYADAHEGVAALLGLIKRVEELGRRFGGLDYVRESLEAIQEFRAEK